MNFQIFTISQVFSLWFFSSKVSVPKLVIYGFLPQYHIKKWLSVKNVLKLAIFDKRITTFLVIWEPKVIWRIMFIYRISEFEFWEFILNPRYSWVLSMIKRSFFKLLGKLVFQCDCEVTIAVKTLKKYPFLLLNQAQSNFFCTSL